MKIFSAALIVLSLVGCSTATKPPVPKTEGDYTGPLVLLKDGGSKAESKFFAVLEIDGRPVKNSLDGMHGTEGKGGPFGAEFVQRQVPLRRMELKIIAIHVRPPLNKEIASIASGTFFEIAVVVPFEPEQGRTYEVTGVLEKAQSCVWIMDAETRQQASPSQCTLKAAE